MTTIDNARELLKLADVFYGPDEDDDELEQTLNLNDVFGWAMADCEYVPDEDLTSLADMYGRYGWCGVLYWVSEKRDGMRSEFQDVNRAIDFVRHEEELRKHVPDSSTRAYRKLIYTLGES